MVDLVRETINSPAPLNSPTVLPASEISCTSRFERPTISRYWPVETVPVGSLSYVRFIKPSFTTLTFLVGSPVSLSDVPSYLPEI